MLRKQRAWSEEAVDISHFRDRAAGEIDLILEAPDGRVAGLDVKSTSRLKCGDTKWLSQLRDRLGARFVGGLVLYTGMSSAPFGERIAAAPMDVLWTA